MLIIEDANSPNCIHGAGEKLELLALSFNLIFGLAVVVEDGDGCDDAEHTVPSLGILRVTLWLRGGVAPLVSCSRFLFTG